MNTSMLKMEANVTIYEALIAFFSIFLIDYYCQSFICYITSHENSGSLDQSYILVFIFLVAFYGIDTRSLKHLNACLLVYLNLT